MKKEMKIAFLIVAIAMIVFLSVFGGYQIVQKCKTIYTASDFNIEIVHSKKDYNQNGIDDYTDILLGARKDAKNHPIYKSEYYKGGYPPENEGVCTDVIWRAFQNAGYDLKEMIDTDIKEHIKDYPAVNGKPDSNIDFRRVRNLTIYFKKISYTLTNDPKQISQWQPGDIVVFGNSHIGIISDKRNKQGITYLIHNAGQPLREEDTLELWNSHTPITAHYRLKDE